jgi:L-ascorbate metabolism protein UlaG (beta-lactamase superfamily)
VVEDSEVYEVKGIKVEGCGDTHATIYPTLPKIQNIGYFIADSLFYPGDVFYNPKRRVDILALPIAGPWMKMSEALDFAKELSPRICVPVHDGILSNPSWFYRNPKLILEPLGIKFLEIENNKTVQL